MKRNIIVVAIWGALILAIVAFCLIYVITKAVTTTDLSVLEALL